MLYLVVCFRHHGIEWVDPGECIEASLLTHEELKFRLDSFRKQWPHCEQRISPDWSGCLYTEDADFITFQARIVR